MALKDSAVRTPSMVDYKIGQNGEDTMRTDIPAARQGLLKFIAKQGGLIPMRALHTHSLVFYQAGHQAFSQTMEGLVADELVVLEDGALQLTDKGRASLGEETP
jgi:hypothetical protein